MNYVQLGRTGHDVSRVGLGGMPLSIQGRPENREDAKAVIHRAVRLGVNFIDTADVYCLDEGDIGHNERLIREALQEIGADEVIVATKGGLVRPEGRWENNARPRHLRRAVEQSLRALDTDTIELYQLHAPDPRVPLEESVGEISRFREEGKVRQVGLSNVTLEQLQEAERIVPITSVQNRYNPWDRSAEETGLIGYCEDNSITFLPYSPVGGGRRVKLLRASEPLRCIGARHGDASPEEMVLAWILAKSPTLVPIPGASRTESIESSVRAEQIEIDAETVEELEEVFRGLPD